MLGNTASAILQARDHLNRDSMDRAMRLIAAASRVEVYAVGRLRRGGPTPSSSCAWVCRLLPTDTRRCLPRSNCALNVSGAHHQQQRTLPNYRRSRNHERAVQPWWPSPKTSRRWRHRPFGP